MQICFLQIAIDAPLDTLFDYRWILERDDAPLPQTGQLVLVPFGRREAIGLIVAVREDSDMPAEKLRDALEIRTQVPQLSEAWLDLSRFAAKYYQRSLGEVAIPCLPKKLRAPKSVSIDRALKKLAKEAALPATQPQPDAPELNGTQHAAVTAITEAQHFTPFLLHGVTGSGKTEVYLQSSAQVLARTPNAQILILVPEINLTPQLEKSVCDRFPETHIVTLHSGLAEAERLRNWLSAHTGQAQIILGTRLAILASLPHLQLIVVDEEHDPSYKQQEGLRYSARDLAVWRAQQLDIPIVMGSATPSLESWSHARNNRYKMLSLPERAVQDAALPTIRLVDAGRNQMVDGYTAAMLAAIQLRLERNEQSLLFLNRRGYAPVLTCYACGWVSHCPRCTAFMVLHQPDRRLRCHHCSLEISIPHHCPTCGNVDLQPLGRGTQRIEESLHTHFPDANILRIDADSTRRKGSAQAAFQSVHEGEVDILIGTQMVAKGHDFQNLTLVGVLNPDTALFSHDYRASERLFAQLMQVAGRAGRAAQKDGSESEVLIQTRYPQHPLYAALQAHDYGVFANALLEERQQASLPPYSYQALLRAEARELEDAIDFLEQAAKLARHPQVTVNDPIPMTVTRVANVNRAQLLLESVSRAALQAMLRQWMPQLRGMKTRVRWTLEVDPADI